MRNRKLLLLALVLALALSSCAYLEMAGQGLRSGLTGETEETEDRFENIDPFAPWNDPLQANVMTKPWNDPLYANDSMAPWNDPMAAPGDYERYCNRRGIPEWYR